MKFMTFLKCLSSESQARGNSTVCSRFNLKASRVTARSSIYDSRQRSLDSKQHWNLRRKKLEKNVRANHLLSQRPVI